MTKPKHRESNLAAPAPTPVSPPETATGAAPEGNEGVPGAAITSSLSLAQAHTIQAQAEEIVGLLKDKTRLDNIETALCVSWGHPDQTWQKWGEVFFTVLEKGRNIRAAADAAWEAVKDPKAQS